MAAELASTSAWLTWAAKAGFLLGEEGPAWLDARGIPARFLAADGAVTANRAWTATGVPACT
jgi:hypothetical protein